MYPPCKDDPYEFYQSEGSSGGYTRGLRLHCVHPDHPENPRARQDENYPKLKTGVGRRPEVGESPKHSQSE